MIGDYQGFQPIPQVIVGLIPLGLVLVPLSTARPCMQLGLGVGSREGSASNTVNFRGGWTRIIMTSCDNYKPVKGENVKAQVRARER